LNQDQRDVKDGDGRARDVWGRVSLFQGCKRWREQKGLRASKEGYIKR
jgi:hypothetical protein